MPVLHTRSVRPGLVVAAVAVATSLLTVGTAQAVTGPEAASGPYASIVQLALGDEATGRACTATLVDPRWVLTAASCFATTPGVGVPAGKPALKTIATSSDGRRREIVEVSAGAADRDLLLARLATPAVGIPTVKRAATAPASGAEVTAAGFGRTKTEWVPGKLHSGTFTLNSSDGATLALTGKGADAICKGDTGGPLLNAAGELVGVNSRSWQGGCLGTDPAEIRTGAIAARADNIAGWIDQTVAPRQGGQVSLIAAGGGASWSQTGDLAYGEYGASWDKIDGLDISRISTVRHGDTVRAYAIAGGQVYSHDLDLSTGKWSVWGQIPGGAAGAKDITAALVGDTVHVLIVGSEGNLYAQAADYKAGRWNTYWTPVGATGLTHITSAAAGTTVRVQGIGGGGVYGRDLDTRTGNWTSWGAVPGGIDGAVDIASSTVGNNVHVQVIGADGAIWTQFGNYDAGRWNSAWTKAGGTGLTRISSIASGNTVELYAVGTGGRITNASMETATGSWSSFAELPGGLGGASDVAATVAAAPSKVTLAASAGNTLFSQNGQLDTGSFGAQWTNVGGVAITRLAAVDAGTAIRYVGVAGGKVYGRDFDTLTSTWGNWTEIPGGAGGVRDIAASMINNVMYVQILGSEGALYTQAGDYNAGRWNTTWTPVAGMADMTAISSAKAGSYVRLYGVSGGKAYGRDLDTRTGKWTVWGELPGGFTGAKDIAVSVTGHTVHVQVIGADGALHAQAGDYLAGNWKPTWTKVGGTGLTRVTSAHAANNVLVYATGASGRVRSTTLDTTTGSWTAWRDIPGSLTDPADLTATTGK
ncbi:trypsin-like serine protease [Streptomyces sp. NPDC060334]|uniref:trypsin-like serine protease n=1 Tax=Streptomyces sp. NPDC060334 TaxID=3347099 RepID=UPI00364C2FD3